MSCSKLILWEAVSEWRYIEKSIIRDTTIFLWGHVPIQPCPAPVFSCQEWESFSPQSQLQDHLAPYPYHP